MRFSTMLMSQLRSVLFGLMALAISYSCVAPSTSEAGVISIQEDEWDEQWAGAIEVGEVKLRLLIQVNREDDQWQGQLVSLDQNQAQMQLKSFEKSDGVLRFELNDVPAEFEGTLSDDGKRAVGKWMQGGTEVDLTLEIQDDASKPVLLDVWVGTLVDGERELRMRFRVLQNKDDEIFVELDSLDEGINGILGETKHEGNEVTVTFAAVGATYEGTFNDARDRITGQWKQRGVTIDLNLEPADDSDYVEQTLVETWVGDMTAGLRELRMQFRIMEDDEGNQTVLFDSLTEGANGIEGTLTRDGSNIEIVIPVINATFTGTLNDEETEIDGDWSQGPVTIDLNLEKVAAPESTESAAPARPQTPEEPFPYHSEDVEIINTEADVKLAGTLTLPEGPGRFPAVVLVSGSGPQDRDETLLGHKPFLVLADHLTRNGIAVLRFDDRGVFESTGDFEAATSLDFATDASACVDYLKAHDSIDADAIGIMGHSEGGLIAPIVASKRPDLGFIVMLAGPGVTGEEIILEQTRLIAGAEGESEENLDDQEAFLRKVVAAVKESNAGDDISETLETLVDEMIAGLSDEDRAIVEAQRGQMVAQIDQFQSPWFRYFLVHDPVPFLEQVTCPVLSIIGEKDLQVPPEQSNAPIRAALEKSGNEDFRVETLPNLNHLFQPSDTGSPTEYQSIEITFDPGALDLITEWINERFSD